MILIFHPVVIDTYLYSMRQDKNRDITCFELTPLFGGIFDLEVSSTTYLS